MATGNSTCATLAGWPYPPKRVWGIHQLSARLAGPRRGKPSSSLKYFLNLVGGFLRSLVLPDSNDGPAQVPESQVGVLTAVYVARDLPRPPIGVLASKSQMLGTTVPEASIHHDSQSLTGEGDVHPSQTEHGAAGVVNPVTKASCE